jgi:hypothetical protein
VAVLLENPSDSQGTYPAPVPGIQYRLDPGGDGYFFDEEGNWVRLASDGTEYGIDSAGNEYRKDPDGGARPVRAGRRTAASL